MERYPAIIVVEGNSDEALISSFLDADIVKTNGSAVPKDVIDYLKEVSKTRDIVVLTDPDSPGKRIRDVLDKEIPNLQHAFVRKEVSIKRHKVGVAESTKEEILSALSHLVPSKQKEEGTLTMADLNDLGLMGSDDSSKRRKILEDELHVGHTNAKTLLKRLNALAVSKERIKVILDGR